MLEKRRTRALAALCATAAAAAVGVAAAPAADAAVITPGPIPPEPCVMPIHPLPVPVAYLGSGSVYPGPIHIGPCWFPPIPSSTSCKTSVAGPTGTAACTGSGRVLLIVTCSSGSDLATFGFIEGSGSLSLTCPAPSLAVDADAVPVMVIG